MGQQLMRVGYVEDDPDIREIGEVALAEIGEFDLVSFESGDRAVAELPAFEPELILLDVMMPGMDGEMTLKALREIPQTTNTPVVFMTAKSQKHDIARYMGLGAAEVISKPFNPLTLADDVRDIWARARGTTGDA